MISQIEISRIVFLTVILLTPFTSVAAQDDSDLEQCSEPVGTLAVVEPQNEVLRHLRRYKLQSPTSLIRMMVQQSNCFLVVERGAAMQNLMQERELARSGELQQGENVGAGQMKAADFVMTPEVIFSEDNAGGIGGAVAGILGRRNRAVGALAGGLKFKEAQTSLIISDTRSGIQIASAEGRAKKTDFRLGMIRWGGGSAAAVGGYTNTNEGKVIAASFLDNFNEIVRDVRTNADWIAGTAGRDAGPKAGAVFQEGDILIPKIDNVHVLSSPQDGAESIARGNKADEFVFLGDEENGFVYVQGGAAAGWIKKVLMSKP